ncbi:MAG: hypothetical protein HOO91_06090 [Bacteroidales bacterium]|nr:hypothetical protein [Bacteroidales bacterium]
MAQRTIWMQLLLIGILSSFQSCKKVDRSFIEEYNLINKTEYQIDIEVFNRIDHGYYKSTYNIPKDSVWVQKIDLDSGSKTGIIALADSVSVIFDNTKILNFLPYTESPFNILNQNNYDLIEIKENYHKYTFVINEEMYNNTNFIK